VLRSGEERGAAPAILTVLVGTFQALGAQIQVLDAEITRRAKADPVARRFMTIPGIGPIAATAITAFVPAPEGFRAGRDFAAWRGLVPLQRSTGGKQKLGPISRMGGPVSAARQQARGWRGCGRTSLGLTRSRE
jgi:transposase